MEALDPSPAADTTSVPLPPRLREAALIAILALTLHLVGNGRVSLWDRDEPRYAGCTREMRISGDWIHPTFNAEPRYHKPVLIYWLMLAGTAIGGDNPFGARLVSSLFGTGTCLLVWAFGRRILGPRSGLMAGLIAATAPILVVESKLATTDATLAFLLVSCQFALWELSKRESRFAAGAFWVCLALATLTKGPVGPALIAVSGVVSWWWGGPTGCWKRLRWAWGLAAFILITAPWFVAIGLISRGEFYRVAMGRHVIQRMTTGMETHGGFPGYYIVGTLLFFYPWSALLPPAVLGAWSRRKASPAFGFLLGWVVGPLVMLECLGTKIVHYYLPAIPACALLTAWLIDAVARSEVNLRRWALGGASLGLLTGIGIAMTVGLLAAGLLAPSGLRWPSLVLAVILAVGTLYALDRFRSGAIGRASASLVATWSLLLFLGSAWLTPAAEPYRISPIVGRKLAALIRQTPAKPMMGTFQPPDIVYYLGRSAPVIQGRKGLLEAISREGPVAVALTPHELTILQNEPRLACDVRETISGFNVERCRNDTVHIVLIRLGPSALAGRVEQAGIK